MFRALQFAHNYITAYFALLLLHIILEFGVRLLHTLLLGVGKFDGDWGMTSVASCNWLR